MSNFLKIIISFLVMIIISVAVVFVIFYSKIDLKIFRFVNSNLEIKYQSEVDNISKIIENDLFEKEKLTSIFVKSINYEKFKDKQKSKTFDINDEIKKSQEFIFNEKGILEKIKIVDNSKSVLFSTDDNEKISGRGNLIEFKSADDIENNPDLFKKSKKIQFLFINKNVILKEDTQFGVVLFYYKDSLFNDKLRNNDNFEFKNIYFFNNKLIFLNNPDNVPPEKLKNIIFDKKDLTKITTSISNDKNNLQERDYKFFYYDLKNFDLTIARIVDYKYFEIDKTKKVILTFIFLFTLYLLILVIVSFRKNKFDKAKEKLSLFTTVIIEEMMNARNQEEFEDIRASLGERKDAVLKNISNEFKKLKPDNKKSLEDQFDNVLKKVELTFQKKFDGQAGTENIEKLEKLFEKFINTISEKGIPINYTGAVKTIEGKSVEKRYEAKSENEAEEVEEIGEAEEVEELEEIGDVEEISEVEEIGEAEDVEEIGEAEEVSDVENAEDLTEVEETGNIVTTGEISEKVEKNPEEDNTISVVKELSETENIENVVTPEVDSEELESLENIEEFSESEAVTESDHEENVGEIEYLEEKETPEETRFELLKIKNAGTKEDNDLSGEIVESDNVPENVEKKSEEKSNISDKNEGIDEIVETGEEKDDLLEEAIESTDIKAEIGEHYDLLENVFGEKSNFEMIRPTSKDIIDALKSDEKSEGLEELEDVESLTEMEEIQNDTKIIESTNINDEVEELEEIDDFNPEFEDVPIAEEAEFVEEEYTQKQKNAENISDLYDVDIKDFEIDKNAEKEELIPKIPEDFYKINVIEDDLSEQIKSIEKPKTPLQILLENLYEKTGASKLSLLINLNQRNMFIPTFQKGFEFKKIERIELDENNPVIKHLFLTERLVFVTDVNKVKTFFHGNDWSEICENEKTFLVYPIKVFGKIRGLIIFAFKYDNKNNLENIIKVIDVNKEELKKYVLKLI